MSEQEVAALLDTVVTVSVVNGKVALKTFDKTKRAP